MFIPNLCFGYQISFSLEMVFGSDFIYIYFDFTIPEEIKDKYDNTGLKDAFLLIYNYDKICKELIFKKDKLSRTENGKKLESLLKELYFFKESFPNDPFSLLEKIPYARKIPEKNKRISKEHKKKVNDTINDYCSYKKFVVEVANKISDLGVKIETSIEEDVFFTKSGLVFPVKNLRKDLEN